MKKLCIYHGNCADGFTSAWVVRKALGAEVDFHAGVYQDEPPNVEGRDVLLVDFSYKRPVLERVRDMAASVLVLDHHKTAEADLRDLKGVQTVFDMNRSGARITWDYFFPDTEPPKLLLHVEDRDLWRFALPWTREIQANIFSYPYDFAVWDRLMTENVESLAKEGYAIERKHFKDINELVAVVTRRMNIGGYNVPIANLPYTLTSDAGHLLAKGEPFAGCYWDTPAGRVFSLRSQDDGLDVGEIAKQYGGGGHKHASGFRLPYADAAKLEAA
ncbi:MAG TPA: DHHA1 domain-containing protein [Candidatus Binatia bacterium]|nr:DHHA1 domain-containing protein [Candidatus Binatia bacterium]